MSSLKQIEANRQNALKSTGRRTQQGKQRSSQNALRHGLTAETVIVALESAADYEAFDAGIAADYQPRTATERELVSRLASVLWRLRRSTAIETGLLQIYGQMQNDGSAHSRRRSLPLPQWDDDLDKVPATNGSSLVPNELSSSAQASENSQNLGQGFVRANRLEYGVFDLLTRYETMLWRQAAKLMFMLQATGRR